MLKLQHNKLSTLELTMTQQKMVQVADPNTPYEFTLGFTLLDKPRTEIYGFILGAVERLGLCSAIGITCSEFLDFLIDVDRNYLANPYHSFYHAADVTIVIYHMICNFEMATFLSRVDMALLIIAALCHDICHPGLNNNYQVNLKTEIAARFGNKSVLESLSCTTTMDLLSKHNLLRNIQYASVEAGDPTTEKHARADIIRMILATDMAFHYELQDNLAGLLEIVMDMKQGRAPHHGDNRVRDIFSCCHDNNPLENFDAAYFVPQPSPISSPRILCLNHEERQCLCQIVLHAADISNALRPWPICLKWSSLVCEEFFRQGDAEREHGLPISPSMDRETVSQSTIGLQFGDFVVSPYYEIFAALFPKADVMLQLLEENRRHWLLLEKLETRHPPPATSVSPQTVVGQTHRNRGRHSSTGHQESYIISPQGRRVSAAAGMLIIPDSMESRYRGSGKYKSKYPGFRSASDTNIDVAKDDRLHPRSEELQAFQNNNDRNTFLQPHRIELNDKSSIEHSRPTLTSNT